MAVRYQFGQFSRSETFYLIHGGAGPEDAKGERFKVARNRLIDMCEDFYQSPTPEDPKSGVMSWAKMLENDPHFNAGYGCSLQMDGRARVSASFMESSKMKFSAVINVENIRHPSLLALELQNRRNCILDGLGSASLAKELGHPLENLITAERLERLQILQASQEGTGKFGTIGCLGVGHDQNLAAVTSTGGVGNEVPGRVGDTPSIAGNYCNKVAAVSCTGIGEQIQAMGLAHGLCLRIEDGMSFKSAVQKTADEASARDFELAFIAASWNSNQQQVEWAAVEINSKLLWLAMSSQGLVEVCAP